MPDAWLPSPELEPESTEHLVRSICRAADLSRPPLQHALVPQEQAADSWVVRLEARDPSGERQPLEDLELEIYGSAADPSLQLAWCVDEAQPLLWRGKPRASSFREAKERLIATPFDDPARCKL